MTQFPRNFVTSIDGTDGDLSINELSGGISICYIFNNVFVHALANIALMQSPKNPDIRTPSTTRPVHGRAYLRSTCS
jgi:hypothetical protein